MCDTLAAVGPATADGSVILAKNSDREPNESQSVLRVPAARHEPGAKVRCTYLEIPQVAATYEILLSKPFWMWGAEMGANERGVAIGNEAVFTKTPYGKAPGLIGMDFLRLALERAATAAEARDVIIGLLEEHGQSGNCGFRHKTYYHNSFLIADPREAWVLETSGREWAAVRVRDVRTISNGLTIGEDFDMASAGLVETARRHGWIPRGKAFDFARDYSDAVFTRFSRCRERRRRTEELLRAAAGRIDPALAASILRDHGAAAGPAWTPARGLAGFTVCAHAGFGPIRATGTTGSMISHLKPGTSTHFLTGTAAPCTGLFKPVWLGSGGWPEEPLPAGTYDEATRFWRHEALHRAVLRDYPAHSAAFRDERDALERRFMAEAAACPPEGRAELAARCRTEADAAEARWTEAVQAQGARRYPGFLYASAWRARDRAARMPRA